MSTPFDIVGIGALAVDELHRVSDYPSEDTKARVLGYERCVGGLVGNALVAAARLGAHCAYAGVLGDDPDSRFVREALACEGIDLSGVRNDPEARPFHGTIIISETTGSRTVLSRLACPGTLPLTQIPQGRVILIDHHFPASAHGPLDRMRARGAQVVADLERAHERTSELEALADHLIVPLGYARARTGLVDARQAALSMWNRQHRLVAVTDGSAGCWYAEDGEIRHQEVYQVDAVETNGCGDVFHGAYAWSLLHGWDAGERMRRASAAAAVKASGRGLTALRGRAEVEALLLRGVLKTGQAIPSATTAGVAAAATEGRIQAL